MNKHLNTRKYTSIIRINGTVDLVVWKSITTTTISISTFFLYSAIKINFFKFGRSSLITPKPVFRHSPDLVSKITPKAPPLKLRQTTKKDFVLDHLMLWCRFGQSSDWKIIPQLWRILDCRYFEADLLWTK